MRCHTSWLVGVTQRCRLDRLRQAASDEYSSCWPPERASGSALFAGVVSMKRLVRLRLAAFAHQHGRCYYCQLVMAQTHELEAFAACHGISRKQARALECTAEHLQARCDGGKDCPENIVAACRLCNQRRHKRPRPLCPQAFQELVRHRMDKGRWHCEKVLSRCRAP